MGRSPPGSEKETTFSGRNTRGRLDLYKLLSQSTNPQALFPGVSCHEFKFQITYLLGWPRIQSCVDYWRGAALTANARFVLSPRDR